MRLPRRLGSKMPTRLKYDPRTNQFAGSTFPVNGAIQARATRPFGAGSRVMIFDKTESTGGKPAYRDTKEVMGWQFALHAALDPMFSSPKLNEKGVPALKEGDPWPGVIRGMATTPSPINPGGSVLADNTATIPLPEFSPRHAEAIGAVCEWYYEGDARKARDLALHRTKLDSVGGVMDFLKNEDKLIQMSEFFLDLPRGIKTSAPVFKGGITDVDDPSVSTSVVLELIKKWGEVASMEGAAVGVSGPTLVGEMVSHIEQADYRSADLALQRLHDRRAYFNGWPASRMQPLRKGFHWSNGEFILDDPDETDKDWLGIPQKVSRLILVRVLLPDGREVVVKMPRSKFRVVHIQPGVTNDAYQVAHETLRLLRYQNGGKGLTDQGDEYLLEEAARLPILDEFDVEKCDKNMPFWAYWELQRVRQRTKNYPSVAAWMGLLNIFSPRFVTSDLEGTAGAAALGDPNSTAELSACTGNSSGTSDTTENNGDLVTADIVVRWSDDWGVSIKEARDVYRLALRHEHPAVSIDQRGDDLKIRTRDLSARARYVFPLTRPPAGRYMYSYARKLFPEFEGRQEVEIAGKRVIAPSLSAIWEKIAWAERTVEDKTQPGHGMDERLRRLMSIAAGERQIEVADPINTAFFGVPITDHATRWMKRDKAIVARNDMEREVIQDPEKLMYKTYPPGAISNSVILLAYAILHRSRTVARYTHLLGVSAPAIPEV